MKNFYQEIKERKIRKWFAIYLSSCVTVIGLLNLFSLRYQFPPNIFDSLLIIIIFGFFSVAVLVWYHGKEGKQKIKKREIVFHSIIFLSAVFTAYLLFAKDPVRILPYNAKVVAVLPFLNMSDSKEDEYFSNGITEDILTNLSKISDLKVISRTSVMKYKNTNLSLKEIANELGAGTILEGSVRIIGEKVRITGQLINANNDEHLWAATYDRKMDDIFKVQSEIAERIANELEAQLVPKEKLLLESEPTDNIEAYAFYLRGRELAERYTDEDNERAIEYYKKALKIDPDYALAYAGLASSYDQKVRRYLYPVEWQDSAVAMSKKSLEINPNLAEGHSSLAKSYEAKGDFKLAKYHYEEAIRLNPNFSTAIHNLAVVHFDEGNLDEAYKLVKKSILLKPNDIFSYVLMGGIYQKFGCNGFAVKWFEKALTLDNENLLTLLYITEQFILMKDLKSAEKYFNKLLSVYAENFYVLFLGGKLEMLKGDYSKSKKYFEKSNSINKDGEYEFAYVLKKINRNNDANKILMNEMELHLEQEKEVSEISNLNAKNLADIFGIIGDNEKSLYWLNIAVDRGWTGSGNNYVYPYLESVRSSDRFNEIMKKMQFKVDSMKTIAISFGSELKECN